MIKKLRDRLKKSNRIPCIEGHPRESLVLEGKLDQTKVWEMLRVWVIKETRAPWVNNLTVNLQIRLRVFLVHKQGPFPYRKWHLRQIDQPSEDIRWEVSSIRIITLRLESPQSTNPRSPISTFSVSFTIFLTLIFRNRCHSGPGLRWLHIRV